MQLPGHEEIYDLDTKSLQTTIQKIQTCLYQDNDKNFKKKAIKVINLIETEINERKNIEQMGQYFNNYDNYDNYHNQDNQDNYNDRKQDIDEQVIDQFLPRINEEVVYKKGRSLFKKKDDLYQFMKQSLDKTLIQNEQILTGKCSMGNNSTELRQCNKVQKLSISNPTSVKNLNQVNNKQKLKIIIENQEIQNIKQLKIKQLKIKQLKVKQDQNLNIKQYIQQDNIQLNQVQSVNIKQDIQYIKSENQQDIKLNKQHNKQIQDDTKQNQSKNNVQNNKTKQIQNNIKQKQIQQHNIEYIDNIDNIKQKQIQQDNIEYIDNVKQNLVKYDKKQDNIDNKQDNIKLHQINIQNNKSKQHTKKDILEDFKQNQTKQEIYQDIQKDIKQNIKQEVQYVKEDIKQDIKQNIKEDIQQNQIQQDIKQNIKQDIKQNVKEDIKQNIKENIQQNQIQQDIKQNIKQDIKQNVKEDIQQNIKQDKKEDVQQDIQQNIKQNLKDDIKQHIKVDKKEDIQQHNKEDYNIKEDIKQNIQQKIQQDIQQIQQDIKQNIKEDIQKDIQKDVQQNQIKQNMKQQIKQDAKYNQTKQEIYQDIQQDIKQNIKQDIKQDIKDVQQDIQQEQEILQDIQKQCKSVQQNQIKEDIELNNKQNIKLKQTNKLNIQQDIQLEIKNNIKQDNNKLDIKQNINQQNIKQDQQIRHKNKSLDLDLTDQFTQRSQIIQQNYDLNQLSKRSVQNNNLKFIFPQIQQNFIDYSYIIQDFSQLFSNNLPNNISIRDIYLETYNTLQSHIKNLHLNNQHTFNTKYNFKKILEFQNKTNIDIHSFIQKQYFQKNKTQNPLLYRTIKNKPEVQDIINESFQFKNNWEEMPHGQNLGQTWNLMWTWSHPSIDFNKLIYFQKINHFQNNKNIVRKDLLCKNIMKNQKISSKCHKLFNIIPETFCLPKEYIQFSESFHKEKDLYQDKNYWIIKPIGKSRGRGISLINELSSVIYAENIIVQKYIQNPLLINDYKFDLRIYVLVTSFKPLECFIYKEGFARLTTEKYSLNPQDIDKLYVHLTNVSVQKNNQKDQNEDCGTKISLKMLQDELQDCNWDTIWINIQQLVIKTLLCCQNDIIQHSSSFELFGFDIMLDQNLKCWLIEVNSSPSLSKITLLDTIIKQTLIDDIIDLLDPLKFNKEMLCQVLERKLKHQDNNTQHQLNIDLNQILNGKKIRQYGELPEKIGNFQMISPSQYSLQCLKAIQTIK